MTKTLDFEAALKAIRDDEAQMLDVLCALLEIDTAQDAADKAQDVVTALEAMVATLDDEEAAHRGTLRLLSRASDENTALKKRVAALESDLDTQRTWWPFDEREVSRGWAVSPGEEEPSGFVAVFSDKAEAERYATWRQEQERATDEDERDPSWEYPNVLEGEFRVRIWNSFDPAPTGQGGKVL